MNRRDFVFSAVAAAASGATCAQLSRDIQYVVPFPAGGVTDLMARSVGKSLSNGMQRTVFTENRPALHGQLGAQQVAKGPADGSQILAVTLTHAVNASLYSNSLYDFQTDLRPVAILATSPMVIVVPAQSPIQSMQDLEMAAKAGKLTAGSSGNGSPSHIALALFEQLTKTSVRHVPYQSAAASLQDLANGKLDIVFSNYPESMDSIKAKTLRPISVCSLNRLAALPNVPTALEAGTPGLFIENWTAMMVSAKTPDNIVDQYQKEVQKAMASPEMATLSDLQGFKVKIKTGANAQIFIDDEIYRWRRVVRLAKIIAA